MTAKPHTHKFKLHSSVRVELYNHNVDKSDYAGYDIIKQHKCKCGATRAYELERTVA